MSNATESLVDIISAALTDGATDIAEYANAALDLPADAHELALEGVLEFIDARATAILGAA